jgi:phosphoglycerate kinase
VYVFDILSLKFSFFSVTIQVMQNIHSLKDLSLDSKKVLLRVDFNVPMEDGKITDNNRIKAALPTIEYLLSKGCGIILMSHLGRPKGMTAELSLKPIGKELERLLNRKVLLAPNCVGDETKKMADHLKPGEILLLENLRFHEAEEKPEKDPSFAKQLAALGEFYVNDAFGCAHRAHASIVKVPKLLSGKSAPGFLMEKEIDFLEQALSHPERPFLALIGGAKISSKIGMIKALSSKVDVLAIGGGMAYTFLKAQGYSVGNSLVEQDYVEQAKEILDLYKKKNIPLLLSTDFVIAEKIDENANTRIVTLKEGIPSGFMGLDIGPETVRIFSEEIKKAKTILWNGPMGVFEKTPFAKGTEQIAESFAKAHALTIAGGGETAAAILKTPFASQVSHISTGGGATLEYLEFGSLPGIEVLKI